MSLKKEFIEILLATDDPGIFNTVENEEDLATKVDEIIRTIRKSQQYRIIITWHRLKNDANIDVISGYDINEYKFTIELHHVITIYEIVMVTGRYLLERDGKTTIFAIADEVIKDHNDNIIPLIPLAKTYHEFYHEGLIEYPKDKIIGNYREWIEKYKEYLYEDEIKKYRSLLNL